MIRSAEKFHMFFFTIDFVNKDIQEIDGKISLCIIGIR